MRPVIALIVCVFLMALTGCNGQGGLVGQPPVTYLDAHQHTHDRAAHIYQQFEAQNPNEADAAKDLYDSEQKLIDNARKGVWPASAPVTHP